MSVLQVIKLWFKTVKYSKERNGIIWFWMKHNISRISNLKDGKFYLISIQEVDYY